MATLFNGILEFENETQLNEVLEKMDKELAFKLLKIALDLTTEQFSLVENHAIYKCLIKLKEDGNKVKGDHLHNDDNNGDSGAEVRP
jgi:hypothetical protein